MSRVDPTTYDEGGRNVAIGYNGSAPRLALTLYVYPPDYGGSPDPEQHFRGAVQAALQLNEEARVEKAARMDLPLGEATVQGYNAFIHWPEPNGQVGSFLVLVPQEKRFFKVRVTFELSGEAGPMQHAWATLQEFLRSLTVSRQ